MVPYIVPQFLWIFWLEEIQETRDVLLEKKNVSVSLRKIAIRHLDETANVLVKWSVHMSEIKEIGKAPWIKYEEVMYVEDCY